tara:strand:+ start:245 stop:640 length:396 start_codon:yes stop_codon:yes gene_type:complete
MAITDKDFIGSGLIFPLNIDNKGGVRPETGKALIESSFRTILATPNGTKYFLGQFKSRLNELIEEPNDSIVLSLMRTFIKEAFKKWEKRIEVYDIQYNQGDKSIIVSIHYFIKKTKQQGTFVFPFYNNIIY